MDRYDEEARRLVNAIERDDGTLRFCASDDLADALRAAERRGAERMREACADAERRNDVWPSVATVLAGEP